MEKPPELPKSVEIMKPIPKPRQSLLETSENIVVKSEGVCFMFAGNGEDKQKENEPNKNETMVTLLVTKLDRNRKLENVLKMFSRFYFLLSTKKVQNVYNK